MAYTREESLFLNIEYLQNRGINDVRVYALLLNKLNEDNKITQ